MKLGSSRTHRGTLGSKL